MKENPIQLFDKAPIGHNSELVTIAEVAKLLRISETGVRRLQNGRHLPFVKVGGSVRFLQSDIESYITKRRVAAIG